MNRRPLTATSVVAAAVLTVSLAACGSSSDNGSTSGEDGVGPITYAQGKDTSGKFQGLIDEWNSAHPDEEVTLVELPESADEQRAALAQDFQAHAGSYDVVKTDVVWTSEFAARGWLEPLDDYEIDLSEVFPAAVETGRYDGVQFAAPHTVSGGLLYYRTDLVDEPPATWDELADACEIAESHDMNCYAGQFAQYEGLTVNFSEAVNSAGGSILDEEGNSAIDTPEVREGLSFLVDGFKNGVIPAEAITYKEEEGRRAFQQGTLLFLNNWPYVYSLSQQEGEDSVVQEKVGVAPLPGPDGIGASTLGGHNLAINADAGNKTTAARFIAYLGSPEVQTSVLVDQSNPPVLTTVYDDPELQEQVPYLAMLKESLSHAVPRPASVAYNDLSLAIQQAVYPALQGKVSVEDTLTRLDADVQAVVDEAR